MRRGSCCAIHDHFLPYSPTSRMSFVSCVERGERDGRAASASARVRQQSAATWVLANAPPRAALAHLLRRPGALPDIRVQHVLPVLQTLHGSAPRDLLGNLCAVA